MYIVVPGGRGSLAVRSAGKEAEELTKALDARDASLHTAGGVAIGSAGSWNAWIAVC